MGKRRWKADGVWGSEGAGPSSQPLKRPKLVHETPTSEKIESSRQLRALLVFEQDARRARHGLQSLKLFLENLLFDEGDHAHDLTLLTEYLEAIKPRYATDDAIFLPDLFDTWSYAAKANDESLMSAVVVSLHLLLKATSRSLALLPHSVGICQTLLQEDNQKLLARNLSLEPSKAFVVSPTLKLLREVVTVDGGAFAKRVFRAQTFTFAHLAENLEVVVKGQAEDPKKPYVRTNAVRFLLACLKFLDGEAKKELLAIRNIASHLVYMIGNDAQYLVLEILEGVKKYVVEDQRIPRDIKLRCFNTKTLVRLAALYDYKVDAEAKGSVVEAVHDFLLAVCTTPGGGILYTGTTGLYPKGLVEDLDFRSETRWDNIACLDQVVWMDEFKNEIPISNFVLGEFIPKLRPWSNTKHSELIVAIFKAAPELLSFYYLSIKEFSFDPKLTMTWIGYGAFLFGTMQLPIPPWFGYKARYYSAPPPTSIMLDHILPLPLNQKNLVKCLAGKSNLASFFAVRLLVLALQKLDKARKMHAEAANGSIRTLWTESARKLVDEFSRRVPDLKSVLALYKTTPEANILHREAISRLLLLYFEVTPQLALTANFDVSPFLLSALKRLQKENFDSKDRELVGMELDHLLTVASYSPGMRWFIKADGLKLSLFATLLSLLLDEKTPSDMGRLKEVLETVAKEQQLVLQETGLGAVIAAFQTLRRQDSSLELENAWSFVDNCVTRCATTPLKFLDLMQDLLLEADPGNQEPNAGCVSLLAVAILDQLPFAIGSLNKDALSQLSRFVSTYVGCSTKAGESGLLLDAIFQRIENLFAAHKISTTELDIPEDLIFDLRASQAATASMPNSQQLDDSSVPESGADDEQGLETALNDTAWPPEEDTSAIVKWASKTVEDMVEEGHASALAELLVSKHISMRREALTNILKMAAKIRDSSYDEKDQVWLLLSEVAESSRGRVSRGPVPSAYTAFTAHALEILRSPLHPLYPKLNSFLTKRPTWAPDNIPLAEEILQGEPSEDDKYYIELSWFLTYAADCLRTSADVDTFRKRRLFESILALGSNPYIKTGIRLRLYKIVFRATAIEGGSTTLVTRFGIISWLQSRLATVVETKGKNDDGQEQEGRILKGLMKRIWETCDQPRVTEWSRGALTAGAIHDSMAWRRAELLRTLSELGASIDDD